MVKDNKPTSSSRRLCDQGDNGAGQSIEDSQKRKKDKKRKKEKEKETKRKKKKMKLESTTTSTPTSSFPAKDAFVSRVKKDQRQEENTKKKNKSSHSSSSSTSSSSSLQESLTTNRHESGTTPKASKKTKRKRTDKDNSQNSSSCKESPSEIQSKEEETNNKDATPVSTSENQPSAVATRTSDSIPGRPLVESSELGYAPNVVEAPQDHSVTLLLFYQYVEPPWSESVYKQSKLHVESIAKQCQVTGRMRVAREGLNCTLTGSQTNIYDFCRALRKWKPEIFLSTEFKLTHHLPEPQRFPALKLIPVTELVHYGLEGDKAPPIHRYHGIHLEPKEYHEKLAEENTVVIDVRNHYEAIIGRFDPPPKPPAKEKVKGDPANKKDDDDDDPPAKNKNHQANQKWIDPKMRKSTEFPVWLDDPQTKEQLRGKQVLMYCTGGIRCERASALLKYKMETDPDMKDLGIQGVYQLQGGIDKYFKEFPDGGYWKGKNYVFDKRFAHAPQAVHVQQHEAAATSTGAKDDKPVTADAIKTTATTTTTTTTPLSKCEACLKPWDKFRGKRRCPTCGVPSLICRDCWQADQDGIRKIDKTIRCDLCVEQNIWSKRELKAKEERELAAYEAKLKERGLLLARKVAETETKTKQTKKDSVSSAASVPPGTIGNPDNVTRLYLKNMCRKNMTEEVLMNHLDGITHIVWKTDRKNGLAFLGQGWVEMESSQAAARAVAKSGQTVLGRPLYIEYQPPDGKDAWPPPMSSVTKIR